MLTFYNYWSFIFIMLWDYVIQNFFHIDGQWPSLSFIQDFNILPLNLKSQPHNQLFFSICVQRGSTFVSLFIAYLYGIYHFFNCYDFRRCLDTWTREISSYCFSFFKLSSLRLEIPSQGKEIILSYSVNSLTEIFIGIPLNL